jgi:hypothetical protein
LAGQWFDHADLAGPLGRVPDDLVTEDPGNPWSTRNDPYYWTSTVTDDETPATWWWDRNGDGNRFNTCWDYLDGPDLRPEPEPGVRPSEVCDPDDFAYWNQKPSEYQPDGLEYISADDVARWGGFRCPLDDLGLGSAGMGDVYGSFPWVTPGTAGISRGFAPGNKIYFAPTNPDAFCGQPRLPPAGGERATVPMLPSSWEGKSSLDVRWIDVGGRPGLRFDIQLGAEMDFTAWIGLASGLAVTFNITGVAIHVTMTPRVCGGLDHREFCTRRNDDGSCARVLAPPAPGKQLCSADYVSLGYFPDAKTRDSRDDPLPPTELEPDFDGDFDSRPEPLVIGNNNILFDLDVSADIQSEEMYWPMCALFPVIGWIVCPVIAYLGEEEIDAQATKQAGVMFNTLARILYFGMEDASLDGGSRAAVTSNESYAAADYYLRKWFWWPAVKTVPGLDATRLPNAGVIKFRDIRWKSDEPGVAQFDFAYDEDFDGLGEQADNCPHVYNPPFYLGGAQLDRDGDHVGDACEADADGDGCCEGCDAIGAGTCVCGGADPDPQCDGYAEGDTCHDDDVASGYWLGSSHAPDYDGDGVPDDCDRDDDNDGVDDDEDYCPRAVGPLNLNLDWNRERGLALGDARGNICDDDDDDDGCPDSVECALPGGITPEIEGQPCGDYACVDGLCRTAERDDAPDNEAFPCDSFIPSIGHPPVSNCADPDCPDGCGSRTCRDPSCLERTCVWDPAADAYGCVLPMDDDPWMCDFLRGPPGGGGTGEPVGGPGAPLDMYTAERFYEGFWTATDIIPCPAAIDCCWAAECDDPAVLIVDRYGNEVSRLDVAEATGLSTNDLTDMRVAGVHDVNGNGINDVAVSAPYAVSPNEGARGKIFTFDGGTLELLRIRERDGAFGSTMSRVEGGLAAKVSPIFSLSSLASDSSGMASDAPEFGAAPTAAGMSFSDRWGIQTAFVPAPPNSSDAFGELATAGWIGGRELSVVYSSTCNGITAMGCLAGYDLMGVVQWQAQGWQSGNEFGVSFDSDGTYVVIGIPGYSLGTGGMVRVVEPGRNRSWNITQRGAVSDFGRHVAIVESQNGPHVVASLLRNGEPRVLEMTLRGQVITKRGVPVGCEIVNLVSPTFDDGTTDDRFAIVFRSDTGWVMHQWFEASTQRAR